MKRAVSLALSSALAAIAPAQAGSRLVPVIPPEIGIPPLGPSADECRFRRRLM